LTLQELLDQRPYFWLDLVSLIAVSEVASIVKAWDSPNDSIKSTCNDDDD
jgi:hypothetical protein